MFRFLSLLVSLLLLILIVLAFVRGWVDVSFFNRETENEKGATITVHKDKIKEDMAALKNKTNEASQTVKNETGSGKETEIHGTVQEVGGDKITVAFGVEKSVTMAVGRDTRIRVGGTDGTLAEIHRGDSVTASYATSATRNVAKSIHRD